MALFDANSAEWLWCSELKKNRIVEFSCVCNEFAVGAITTSSLRGTAGLVRFQLGDGSQLGEVEPLPGLCCVSRLGDTGFVAGSSIEESQLHYFMSRESCCLTISSDKHFKVRGVVGTTGQELLTTMQGTSSSVIEFVHQLRDTQGQVRWEHVSQNDTAVRCDENRISLFTNAGSNIRSTVEILHLSNGSLLHAAQVKGSLANLTHFDGDCFVYCNSNYEAVFIDIVGAQRLATCPMPAEFPGWLSFAVDREQRLVLACKGNNFQNPSSTIQVFRH